MNPYFKDLQSYPFEKLKELKASTSVTSDLKPILLSVVFKVIQLIHIVQKIHYLSWQN